MIEPIDPILTVADDIVSQMNDHGDSWLVNMKAERRWNPRVKLEALKDIHVHVVPAGRRGERASRSQWRYEFDYQLGIRKRIITSDPDYEDELDTLVTVAGQVIDFWKTRKTELGFKLLSFDEPAPLSIQELNAVKMGGTFITLTFQGWRDD